MSMQISIPSSLKQEFDLIQQAEKLSELYSQPSDYSSSQQDQLLQYCSSKKNDFKYRLAVYNIKKQINQEKETKQLNRITEVVDTFDEQAKITSEKVQNFDVRVKKSQRLGITNKENLKHLDSWINQQLTCCQIILKVIIFFLYQGLGILGGVTIIITSDKTFYGVILIVAAAVSSFLKIMDKCKEAKYLKIQNFDPPQ